MTDFNVGDRVRLRQHYGHHPAGKLGTIRKPENGVTGLVSVEWDDRSGITALFPARLELTEPEIPLLNATLARITVDLLEARQQLAEANETIAALQLVIDENDRQRAAGIHVGDIVSPSWPSSPMGFYPHLHYLVTEMQNGIPTAVSRIGENGYRGNPEASRRWVKEFTWTKVS